ncbi:TRAP-type transport system, small permease component, predicted N-acetylneuraminate transporter [Geomicrobium sp. JCM 19055]|nr:TRAP-type transport system, small permease component, predicted N-acetylneuraminate transporter [Geomicrobium sp. JCM 19055]
MKSLLNGIEYVFMRAAALFFVVFVVCIFLQLLSRYVPTISLLWPAEIATYAFIWTVFLGASVMVYHQEHFKIDYVFEKFKGQALLYIKLFSHLIIGLFGLLMVIYGFSLVQLFWEWTVNTLPQLQQGYLWLALPISGLGMVLFSIGNALEDVKNFKEKGEQVG